uniref:NADH dehydrogenase subunit 9 n=1 Tax=Melosira undulata TaxID=2133757 RepID=A0A3G1PWG2_9STRA|nr:NADH dehydrogenase subunit 9 [Melosira undulata]AVR57578.1 NADH dehydrogenase subunit 9 [Melosira undulata]
MKHLIIIKQINCLKKILPISKIQLYNNELVIWINSDNVVNVLLFLKYNSFFQFQILTVISAVDYIEKLNRFEIVYDLLSIRYNARIRIKISLNELVIVNSVENVYLSANWFEREIFDMFGIYFSNHTNLKRLLNDYGFEGFPLRKDFPLTGYIEVKYDNTNKKIVSEFLELAQEFRTFDFLTPWE